MVHAASRCGTSSDPSWVARDVQLMHSKAVRMSDWQQQRQLKLADDFEAWANWRTEAQKRRSLWPGEFMYLSEEPGTGFEKHHSPSKEKPRSSKTIC